jgi:hypothetical protein
MSHATSHGSKRSPAPPFALSGSTADRNSVVASTARRPLGGECRRRARPFAASGNLRRIVGSEHALGVDAVRSLAPAARVGLSAAAAADSPAALRRPLAARRAKPAGVTVAARVEFGADEFADELREFGFNALVHELG